MPLLPPFLPPTPSVSPTTLKLSPIPGHWSEVFDKLEVYLSEMNIPPGMRIKVKGDILPDAEQIRINIGMDELNIGLHFNPRFNYLGDVNTIVCNARTQGQWGTEQRERNFPFVPGTTVEVFITFNTDNFHVTMHDGYEFNFPNRLNLTKIDYLSMYGDFNVRKVDFE